MYRVNIILAYNNVGSYNRNKVGFSNDLVVISNRNTSQASTVRLRLQPLKFFNARILIKL